MNLRSLAHSSWESKDAVPARFSNRCKNGVPENPDGIKASMTLLTKSRNRRIVARYQRRQSSHLPQPMTLTTLVSDDVLRLILCYVGDGFTLRNIEKTCHRLKTAVEDDTLWAVPPPIVMLVNGIPQESDDWAEDTRFASNRERACVSENLLAIRLEQDCTSNILIEELGTDGYTTLAHRLLGEYNNSQAEEIHLREDTLETLVELVQHGIILQLQRSLRLVAWGEGSGYPTVTLTSIKQQAELAGMLECLPSNRGQESGPIRRLDNVGIGTRTRDRVIRRLSYRAGVPKMARNAYPFLWEMILHLTEKILVPACMQFEDYNYACKSTFEERWEKAKKSWNEVENRYEKPPRAKTKVQSWQMTRYVQPDLSDFCHDDDGNLYVAITPVPRNLEESSARLGLAGKVYSVLGDPSSIAAVQENYEVTEDIVVIEYEDDRMSRSMDISGFVDDGGDDDEESDFSVYSDTEDDMMSTSDDLDVVL
jgi:hypothetical protein